MKRGVRLSRNIEQWLLDETGVRLTPAEIGSAAARLAPKDHFILSKFFAGAHIDEIAAMLGVRNTSIHRRLSVTARRIAGAALTRPAAEDQRCKC